MSWTRFHWLESCVRGLRSGKTCRFLFCVTAGLSSVGTVDGYVFISHVRRVARLHFSCFRFNCLSDVDYRRRKRARSPPTRSAISTVRVRSPLMASSRPPEFLREYDTSTFFFPDTLLLLPFNGRCGGEWLPSIPFDFETPLFGLSRTSRADIDETRTIEGDKKTWNEIKHFSGQMAIGPATR